MELRADGSAAVGSWGMPASDHGQYPLTGAKEMSPFEPIAQVE